MQEKCGCGGLTQWRWWPPARFWRCSASAHSEEWCPVSSWCPPAASLWLQAPETESGSLLQPGFQKIRTKSPNMFAVECTAHIYVFFLPSKFQHVQNLIRFFVSFPSLRLLTLVSSSCSSRRSSSVMAGGAEDGPTDVTASSPTSGCSWKPWWSRKTYMLRKLFFLYAV